MGGVLLDGVLMKDKAAALKHIETLRVALCKVLKTPAKFQLIERA